MRSHQIHNEGVYDTMPGMFYFTDIFQPIVNCFNNRALAKRYSIIKVHQDVFHLFIILQVVVL